MLICYPLGTEVARLVAAFVVASIICMVKLSACVLVLRLLCAG